MDGQGDEGGQAEVIPVEDLGDHLAVVRAGECVWGGEDVGTKSVDGGWVGFIKSRRT